METQMPGVPVQTRLNLDELGALDSYRRKKPNPPTRGKALRELLRRALQESEALQSIAADEPVVACSAAQRSVSTPDYVRNAAQERLKKECIDFGNAEAG
jgi:hypothetical protein